MVCSSWIRDRRALSLITKLPWMWDIPLKTALVSAAGKEEGYRLVVGEFEALGKKIGAVEVRCHDLKDQGVEGLIGMTFLKQFDWCVHPQRRVISVK